MAPKDKIETDDEELPTTRITTTISYIHSKIIQNLIGPFGNSKSGVISYMIKEWINSNADRLINSYGIDIAGIRRELESSKEISVDEQIQNRLFRDLPLRFKRMKKYNVEKLAALLKVHPQTLVDFITIKGDELENLGLNLEIDGDYIVKL